MPLFKVVKSVYVQADFHPNAEQILTLLQMCWYISIVNSGIVTILFCFEVNQSFNSPILDTSSGCLPLQFMRWMLWHWAHSVTMSSLTLRTGVFSAHNPLLHFSWLTGTSQSLGCSPSVRKTTRPH